MPKKEFYGEIVQLRDSLEGSSYFDGTSFYKLQNPSELAGNKSFCFQAWAKIDPTATLENTIISFGSPAAARAPFMMIHKQQTAGFDSFRVGIFGPDQNYLQPAGFFDGAWFHFTFSYDSVFKIGALYLNAQLVSFANFTASTPDFNPIDFEIGRYIKNNALAFKGEISDVRVWSDARGTDEIQSDWRKKLTGNEPNLLHYLPLDNLSLGLTDNLPKPPKSGTPVNTAWNVDSGISGLTNSVYVNGSTDRVELPRLGIIGNADYTFECMAKMDTSALQNENTLIAFGNNTNFTSPFLAIQRNHFGSGNDAIRVTHWADDTFFAISGARNNWRRYTVTYNAQTKTRKVYYDGVFLGENVLANTPNFNDLNWRIGAVQGLANFQLTGKIQDVRIWNIEREASDILADYNSQLSGNEFGLIGYYQLNEGAGSVVNSTAKSVDGIASSGAVLENSLDFDGVNDYVSLSSAGSAVHNLSAYTVEAWAKAPAQLDKRIYSEASTASNNQLFSLGSDNSAGTKLRAYVRDNTGTARLDVNSVATVFDNSWHHIAWVDTAGTYQLYVDGVLDRSGTYTKNSKTFDRYALGTVLRASPITFFDGKLSDVRFWTTARTGAQILANYQSRLTPPLTGLKSYYRLNSVSGTSAVESVASNNGTLVNFSGTFWAADSVFLAGAGSLPIFDEDKPPIKNRITSGLLDNFSISEYTDKLFAGGGELNVDIPSSFDSSVINGGIQTMDEINFYSVDRLRNRKKKIYSGTIIRIDKVLGTQESVKVKAVGELFFLEKSIADYFNSITFSYGGDSFDVLFMVWFYYIILNPESQLEIDTDVSDDSYNFSLSFANFAEVLDNAQKLCNPNYYWKITPDNVLVGRKFSTTPDKYFYVGADIVELEYSESAEDIVNTVYVTNSKNDGDADLISNKYQKQNSINTYRRRAKVITDSEVDTNGQSDNIANGEFKNTEKASQITIKVISDLYDSKNGVDLDDLEAGQTFKIVGAGEEAGLNSMYVIDSVTINEEFAVIMAEDKRSLTSRRLLEIEEELKKRTANSDGSPTVTSRVV